MAEHIDYLIKLLKKTENEQPKTQPASENDDSSNFLSSCINNIHKNMQENRNIPVFKRYSEIDTDRSNFDKNAPNDESETFTVDPFQTVSENKNSYEYLSSILDKVYKSLPNSANATRSRRYSEEDFADTENLEKSCVNIQINEIENPKTDEFSHCLEEPQCKEQFMNVEEMNDMFTQFEEIDTISVNNGEELINYVNTKEIALTQKVNKGRKTNSQENTNTILPFKELNARETNEHSEIENIPGLFYSDANFNQSYASTSNNSPPLEIEISQNNKSQKYYDLDENIEKTDEEEQENQDTPQYGILMKKALIEFSEANDSQESADDSDCDEVRNNIRIKLLTKIKNILRNVKTSFQSGKPCHISFRSYTSNWDNVEIVDSYLVYKDKNLLKKKTLKYEKSFAKKYSLVVFLLNEIYKLLLKKNYLTKREIYYQNCYRLKRQETIDIAIWDICYLLKSPPWELGILATTRGLVYGNLIIFTNKDKINCKVQGGVLIPQNPWEIVKFETDALCVLVIEKDATFQKLLDIKVQESLKCSMIIITGKGYPDLNTRVFLNKLSNLQEKLPIFVLTDGDPYGIEIMLVYRFGTKRAMLLSHVATVPKLYWVGIQTTDIRSFNMLTKPLTERDKSKIRQIIQRPYMDTVPKIREQLELMLERNEKAEIEGFDTNINYFLEIYISTRVFNKIYI